MARSVFYHNVARLAADRSTCLRGQVGAVIVKEGRIISTGYNGAPPGMPHCLDVGCEVRENGCERAVHAEANAIAWAARVGVPVEGAEMYCTHAMCPACAKLVVAAGIGCVSFLFQYRDLRGVELLRDMGVTVIQEEIA